MESSPSLTTLLFVSILMLLAFVPPAAYLNWVNHHAMREAV